MRHAMTILRGIGALIATLVFVIAVPAGLVSYVGWPLPATLPSIDQLQLALRSGIDPQVLINTLAVIVWIVWFQIVTALTAEASAAVQIRRRNSERCVDMFIPIRRFYAEVHASRSAFARSRE